MSDLAIRAVGLGKRYRIGTQVRYKAMRDTIMEAAKAPLRATAAWVRGQKSTKRAVEANLLWALRDVAFEIKRGEAVGIIGRNGSGKSTLLKVLAQVTEPTEGYAEIRGRVGSLLEVGVGFHPELTGRENIYLNGAILGMRKAEIDRKFDEIVAFAEVEKFLDTPIKHYSSGMYVRLGFAVAAHLETEVLFVDEVLSVGDAAFQEKCLGKIGDSASQGRTVLFVSHNMVAVQSLCTRAICLHEGKVVLQGAPDAITSRYLQNWLPRFREVVHHDIDTAPGNEMFRLRRALIRPLHGSSQDQLTVRTPMVVEFEYWKLAADTGFHLVAQVFNQHGANVFTTARMATLPAPTGLMRTSFIVPADLMNNGAYRIHLAVLLGCAGATFYCEDLVNFEVHDVASEVRGNDYDEWPGVIRPNLEWKTELLDGL